MASTPPEDAEYLERAKARECDDKKKCKDGFEAVKAHAALVKRLGVNIHDFTIYPCRFCDGWHVGNWLGMREKIPARKDENVKGSGQLPLFSIKNGVLKEAMELHMTEREIRRAKNRLSRRRNDKRIMEANG